MNMWSMGRVYSKSLIEYEALVLSAPEQTVEQTIETPMIGDAIALIIALIHVIMTIRRLLSVLIITYIIHKEYHLIVVI